MAEVALSAPAPAPGDVLLVLGHGAGGDIDAPDLLLVRDACLARGVTVALVRQPYRVAGRRAPAPATQLDAAWVAVVVALRHAAAPFGRDREHLCGRKLVVGGRSSGARVACRTAAMVGADAVLALAFPLHPPGKPDRSRAAELEVDRPLLVVQGERDAFGRPAQLPAGPQIVVVAGADHGLRAASMAAIATTVASWVAAAGRCDVVQPGLRSDGSG